MQLRKAMLIWLLIVFAESVNGSIREILVIPAVGDLAAHRFGFGIGAALILFIAWVAAPWLKVESFLSQLEIGGLWLVLTLVFEIAVGYMRGFTWERIFLDYDLTQGRLMSIGLAVVLLAPALGSWLRSRPWMSRSPGS